MGSEDGQGEDALLAALQNVLVIHRQQIKDLEERLQQQVSKYQNELAQQQVHFRHHMRLKDSTIACLRQQIQDMQGIGTLTHSSFSAFSARNRTSAHRHQRSRSWDGSMSTLIKESGPEFVMYTAGERPHTPLTFRSIGPRQDVFPGSPHTDLPRCRSPSSIHAGRNLQLDHFGLAMTDFRYAGHSTTEAGQPVSINLPYLCCDINCKDGTPDYAVLCSAQESESGSSTDCHGLISTSASSPSILQHSFLGSSAEGSSFLTSAPAPVSGGKAMEFRALNFRGVTGKPKRKRNLTKSDPAINKVARHGIGQHVLPLKRSKFSPFTQTNPTKHLVASSRALSVDAQSLTASLYGRGLGNFRGMTSAGQRKSSGVSTGTAGRAREGMSNIQSLDILDDSSVPLQSFSPLYSTIDVSSQAAEVTDASEDDQFLGSSTDLKQGSVSEIPAARPSANPSSTEPSVRPTSSDGSMAVCISISPEKGILHTSGSPRKTGKSVDGAPNQVQKTAVTAAEPLTTSEVLHNPGRNGLSCDTAGVDIPETCLEGSEDTGQRTRTPSGNPTAAFVIPETLNMGTDMERDSLCTQRRSNTTQVACSGSPVLSGSKDVTHADLGGEQPMDISTDLPTSIDAATCGPRIVPLSRRHTSPFVSLIAESHAVEVEEASPVASNKSAMDTDVVKLHKPRRRTSSVASRTFHKVNRARLQRSHNVSSKPVLSVKKNCDPDFGSTSDLDQPEHVTSTLDASDVDHLQDGGTCTEMPPSSATCTDSQSPVSSAPGSPLRPHVESVPATARSVNKPLSLQRSSAKVSDKVRYVVTERTSPTVSPQRPGSTDSSCSAPRNLRSTDVKCPSPARCGPNQEHGNSPVIAGCEQIQQSHGSCPAAVSALSSQSQDPTNASETAWHFVPLPKSDSQLSVDLSAPFPQSPELRMKSDAWPDALVTADTCENQLNDERDCVSPAFFAPELIGNDMAEIPAKSNSASASSPSNVPLPLACDPGRNTGRDSQEESTGVIDEDLTVCDDPNKASPKKKESSWLRRSLDLTKRTTDRWLSRAISATPTSSSTSSSAFRKRFKSARSGSHSALSMSVSDDVTVSGTRQLTLFDRKFFRAKATSLPNRRDRISSNASLGSIDWISGDSHEKGTFPNGPNFSSSTPLSEAEETSRHGMGLAHKTMSHYTSLDEGVSDSPVEKMPLKSRRTYPHLQRQVPPLRRQSTAPESSMSLPARDSVKIKGPMKPPRSSPAKHQASFLLARCPTAPEGGGAFSALPSAPPSLVAFPLGRGMSASDSRPPPSLQRRPSAPEGNLRISLPASSPARNDPVGLEVKAGQITPLNTRTSQSLRRVHGISKQATVPPATGTSPVTVGYVTSSKVSPIKPRSLPMAPPCEKMLSISESLDGKRSALSVDRVMTKNDSSTWIDLSELQQCVDVQARDLPAKPTNPRPETSMEIMDTTLDSQDQSYRLLACNGNNTDSEGGGAYEVPQVPSNAQDESYSRQSSDGASKVPASATAGIPARSSRSTRSQRDRVLVPKTSTRITVAHGINGTHSVNKTTSNGVNDSHAEDSTFIGTQEFIKPMPPKVPLGQEHPYKFQASVRKHHLRDQLPATKQSCCSKYYELDGDGEHRCQHVGRHRELNAPTADTPEDFWNLSFPSSEQCKAKGYVREADDSIPLRKRRKLLNRVKNPVNGS